MPLTINSVYMTMPVPVPTVDPGPQYAFDLNSCFTILDSHTHAPGQGQQITPAGINITTDLSFGGNNSINLRSTRYTAQGGTLSAGADIGCTYVAGVDLYYNDVNGNKIRLTQSGGVAGTPGSIANLLFPASVTYVTGTQTFVFQSSTATAGNIDVGSVKIREVAPSANAITLSSPTSLAANYTLTFPGSLPSSASFWMVDQSGNFSTKSNLVPVVQVLTATTGNYSTPSGAKYLKVILCGGGGGGSGGGAGGGAGGTGGTSSFGTLLTATGGTPGSGTPAGGGGTASLNGLPGFGINGGGGQGAANVAAAAGGIGGCNAFGGMGAGGAGGATNSGGSGAPQTGAGGGGGAVTGGSATPGGGGGAGGYLQAFLYGPQSTYGYAVGTSGAIGTAGTAGGAGGAGGTGVIIVKAYYF